MAITEEKSLMTSEKFNRGVENWTWKVRNTSVNILQRTHATGRLRRELQSRWLKDREGGPAYVGLGFPLCPVWCVPGVWRRAWIYRQERNYNEGTFGMER